MSADTVRELVQAQIGQIAQAVERFAAAERDYAREQQVLSQEEQRQQNVLVMICTVLPSWKQNCSSC